MEQSVNYNKNSECESKDPGAVKFGNFKYYYDFNPVSSRIELLPIDSFPKCEQFYCLDIGCNSGELTWALHEKIRENVCPDTKTFGIDLDNDLIEKASENSWDKITFKQANIMFEDGRDVLKDYLCRNNIHKFDVTFCFSITLWIHINYGDEGLKDFLRYLCSISKIIVVEPQEWKSYKTANRRLRRNNEDEFPEFNSLKIKHNIPEEIERFLVQDCQGVLIKKTEKTHWGRTIFVIKCS